MTKFLGITCTVDPQLYTVLYKPITFLSDPSKRIFWVYLLVSLLLACIILICQRRSGWVRPIYEKLLSPRIWLHPSSLLDIKLMMLKSLIKSLFFLPWLITSYGLSIAVIRLADKLFGPANPSSLSQVTITLLYTTCLFIASDFSRYALHRLCHKVSFLWQFHQVHHSAEVMTPLTLYRSHPFENLLFSLRSIIVTGSIAGCFFYLYGNQTVQYRLLGVNVLGFFFNMLGANLRHSHFWLSYGSILERVLISPAQHQIHHSNHPQHHNKNFGSCLAIWDWILGSLYLANNCKNVHFGLGKFEYNHDPYLLGSSIASPILACWRRTILYIKNR